MRRREFLSALCGVAGMTMASGCHRLIRTPATASQPVGRASQPCSRPNILLITADDMNWNAVGAFGCPVPGTTPNIDQLAAQGMRFQHAHVTVAICQPSRNTIMTGRYPHRCGGEGFYHLRLPDVPILPEQLRQAGYRVGILGKVAHSTPYASFTWDMTFEQAALGQGRNPKIYRQHATDFFEDARRQARPFFLMANSHDPHRPFFGNDPSKWYQSGENPPASEPSRVFKPDEVKTPGFLPDLPDVRREIAEYYSSVRRCDDTVGELLQALAQAGVADNTLVIFLSDNGMAFPFAKTNCYLHSTRTPWIVRWPSDIQPGTVDQENLISGIDLMPTVLDAAGLPEPPGMDGTSFLPLLQGRRQAGRDYVFTQMHQTSQPANFPMRCVQSRQFGYIFNPWADGRRVFRNESQAGRTFKAMQRAAGGDSAIDARVRSFRYRTVEEFYDFRNDPDALHNLIGDPQYAREINDLRSRMEQYMQQTADPAFNAFGHRDDPQALEAFMQQEEVTLRPPQKQPQATE